VGDEDLAGQAQRQAGGLHAPHRARSLAFRGREDRVAEGPCWVAVARVRVRDQAAGLRRAVGGLAVLGQEEGLVRDQDDLERPGSALDHRGG
jgi:hypothetical protein